MEPDIRRLDAGLEIPSEGYSDQPYVAINKDGSWTCVMTTGKGVEGEAGQHVVSCISTDQGKTWSELYDIEPADGPEASWVMPLLVPATGRIYAFYTYNKDNMREVKTIAGSTIKRVDSFGAYAYRYSDDQGRTWSKDRYEIPMRLFATDRNNAYGGKVQFFWGVGKPFIHKDSAYVCASKVGGFGRGFFEQNEGVLFQSSNILTEHDPSKHTWETLPEGDVGLRPPVGGGKIGGEFNATPMADGSLYGTYRTVAGFSCHAYSRDHGRNWTPPAYMTFTPVGRRIKNPRAANFVRRFSNGKYLYWFHFHGGEVFGRTRDIDNWKAYAHRNPAWLCGGVERDGFIHWSQPEIVLYDDDLGTRFSYPDLFEQDGEYYITETQKEIARVHHLDKTLLEGMWAQGEVRSLTTDGLVAKWKSGNTLEMPELPALREGGGTAIDMLVCFADLEPYQILFDSRNAEGRGMVLTVTDRATIKLAITGRTCSEPGAKWSGGLTECSWACDQDLLTTGQDHHIAFSIDGGPKIITVSVDGVLCDGGKERQYGWGRFHANLQEVKGLPEARVAPSLHGELKALRIYNRYLRTSEMVANYHAGKQRIPHAATQYHTHSD